MVVMPDKENLIHECKAVGKALNFEVQTAVDIGAGELDVIWTKKDHPNLPAFKIGFLIYPESGEVPIDFITHNVAKAIISVCDQVIFLVPDEASLRSVKGKITSMDSIGGMLQLKKYAHAITPEELLGGMK
jgi:hypothetical protein